MIMKTLFHSDLGPNETVELRMARVRTAFPNAEIREMEARERNESSPYLILIMKSPFLELPVHFEYDGARLTYTLFGINEAQFGSDPKKEQIESWLNEQARKFPR